MGVSLSGNLINLTVDAGDLGPDELAAMLGSYRKKKRYHRLRDGAFVDLSDFELAQLDRLASDLGITQRSLPRARWSCRRSARSTSTRKPTSTATAASHST